MGRQQALGALGKAPAEFALPDPFPAAEMPPGASVPPEREERRASEPEPCVFRGPPIFLAFSEPFALHSDKGQFNHVVRFTSVIALGAIWTGVALGVSASGRLGAATAFVPLSDDHVLTTLRNGPATADDAVVRDLKASNRADPANRKVAVELARLLIQKSRMEADPRYLSQARYALRFWGEGAEAPAEVLVQRAVIRQSLHDFAGAISDLNRALLADPRNVEAWLVKASIHTVRGEYSVAKDACRSLTPLADTLTTLTATANVASLSGEARRSYELLSAVLADSRKASVDLRIWAHNILADIAHRLGAPKEAEKNFRAALELRPTDPFTLGVFADFLLDQGRPAEVVELLKAQTRVDGLLLRLAEAGLALGVVNAGEVRSQVDTLAARFEAGRVRGDTVHLREEARFQLRLMKNPRQALKLAKANWETQREPIDARLLLEAARQQKDTGTIDVVTAWLLGSRVEDVQLQLTR